MKMHVSNDSVTWQPVADPVTGEDKVRVQYLPVTTGIQDENWPKITEIYEAIQEKLRYKYSHFYRYSVPHNIMFYMQVFGTCVFGSNNINYFDLSSMQLNIVTRHVKFETLTQTTHKANRFELYGTPQGMI